MVEYFFYFLIYSLLGYLCEVTYCSILSKRIVDRGFLYGPICPIYGFGGCLIAFTMSYYFDNPFLVFILSFVLTSSVEFLVSFFLEKIFKLRWWDYSEHKLNINGRVCFFNSCIFGLLSMIVVYVIHPFLENVASKISPEAFNVFTIIFSLLLLIDLVFSILKILVFRGIIKKYTIHFRAFKAGVKGDENDYRLFNKLSERLLNRFPKMRSSKNRLSLESIKEHLASIKNRKEKD